MKLVLFTTSSNSVVLFSTNLKPGGFNAFLAIILKFITTFSTGMYSLKSNMMGGDVVIRGIE